MNDLAAATQHWDRMYESATRSAWTQNSQVAMELYSRMTGEPGFWLDWVFRAGMASRGRLLSIGCGDGAHELFAARQGFAEHIVAFDASPVAVALGRRQAEAENLPIDFQELTFEQFVSTPPANASFDTVLFSGSLHHVRDLEGMLSTVQKILRPGGRVIVNEYIGPCYQLYAKPQVDLVNRVLSSIPDAFRLGPDQTLVLPSMAAIMANDPTEGVRAPLIPVLMPMYFETVYERFLGGALLHPLFGYLNGTKINDESPESRALVSMLIAMENELTQAGVLPHEFMLGVYRLS